MNFTNLFIWNNDRWEKERKLHCILSLHPIFPQAQVKVTAVVKVTWLDFSLNSLPCHHAMYCTNYSMQPFWFILLFFYLPPKKKPAEKVSWHYFYWRKTSTIDVTRHFWILKSWFHLIMLHNNKDTL